MTTLLLHCLAAGLLGAFACGDSPREVAAARDTRVQPKQAGHAPIDVCALLTQAEAEAILGKSIAPPQKRGSSECHYETEPGNGDIMIAVLPLGFKSKEEFHAFMVKDTEEMNARVKENLKGTGATPKETAVEPVPEVGLPAYYVDPSLVILKNGQVLSIVAADRLQAVAVAAKALPRFH
jgi:hypothetical protein